MNIKRLITAMLAGLLVLIMLPGLPVVAADETDVDAEVEVLPAGAMSYGAKVIDFHSVLLARWALDEPDGWGAFIFRNGWVSIKLEDNVPGADTVSIWAASSGWWPSRMKIYASADGRRWTLVGSEKVKSADFLRYDFTDSFGDVKYIKVVRSGWPWSWLRLDAVGVKGGD